MFMFSVAVPLLAGCAGAAQMTTPPAVTVSNRPATSPAEPSTTVVADSPAAPTSEAAAENVACQLMDTEQFKTLTGKELEPYAQNAVGRSSNCTRLYPVPADETGGAYGIHVTADADLVTDYDGTLDPYIAGGGGVTTTVTADGQIILQDDPGPSPTRLIAGIPCAEVDSFRACRYNDYTLLFYPGTKGNVTDKLVESALKKVQAGLL